ncbi:hypothetical protein [Acinetobacter stercoris]|nr:MULTISPECIES: hypothetical protein [Acinetobacter]
MSIELSKEVLTEEDILELSSNQRETETIINDTLKDRKYNIPIGVWGCITIMMGKMALLSG